jgi:hypothetical protein
MNRQTIILIVGLLVALLAGMFIYAYLKQSELDRQAMDQGEEQPADTGEYTISRVDAKHFYTSSEGVHTLAGEIMVPTVCDLIMPAVVTVDDGKRALIDFAIVNNSGDDCAPATGPQRFKVGFGGAEDIQMEAYYKGERIELNVIPAGPDESPADFELYLKG